MKTLKCVVLTLTISLFTTFIFAKEKKVYETVRVSSPPKIDGVLDDPQWEQAPIATDFTVFFPDNGRKAYNKTEARVVYDNKALYISAFMHEKSSDSVSVFLSNRDQMGPGDYFGILINPYNDDQSFVSLFVTSAGVQWDFNGSKSWNVVYKTAVKVVKNGWVAEMEIPFSALRFPKDQNLDWAFNIIRYHAHYSGESSWNFMDRDDPNTNTQLGLLRGIKDVDPPLRLSLSPYFSTYLNHNGETDKWSTDFKGGLDVKYGINESFTLDMMLIPDFGQVQSDDIIQNLSPFETYYQEKRQFFTEGQQLFNRGHLFYSRRIGNRPRRYWDAEDNLGEHQILIENPAESKLINATKISGKNSKGISIGVLNAMTKPMEAEFLDTISGEISSYNTQSFTNYNVSVIEKSLKYNSYISLINTNVLSPADHFSANVIGTEYNFYDKNTNYNLSGNFAYSRVKEDADSDAITGIKYRIHIGKENGNFRFGMARNVASENYDQNDLGFFRRNNYINHAISLNHHIIKPTWIFKEWRTELFAEHNTLYKPLKYSDSFFMLFSRGEFTNNYRFGFYYAFFPTEIHDYYESRTDGRVFMKPKRYEFGSFFNTDRNKKIVWRHRFEYEICKQHATSRFEFNFYPILRLKNNFEIQYIFSLDIFDNSFGYIDDIEDTDDIMFGKRYRKIISNEIEANYIFNNKSSLSFRLRHYASSTKYDNFYYLNQEGYLDEIDYFSKEHNSTFNTFNIDLAYRWEFAPGSELSIVWKNAILNDEDEKYEEVYFSNVDNLFKSPQHNSLSVKILYYLDWQYLKKRQ